LSRLLTASCAAILALVPTSSQAADKDQKLDFRYEPEEVATADAAATLYERIIALAEAECRMISNPPIIIHVRSNAPENSSINSSRVSTHRCSPHMPMTFILRTVRQKLKKVADFLAPRPSAVRKPCPFHLVLVGPLGPNGLSA
jgi:hypothetical protein